jgi:hypothetical protein
MTPAAQSMEQRCEKGEWMSSLGSSTAKESYDDILRETRQVRQTLSEGGKVTARLAFAGARC